MRTRGRGRARHLVAAALGLLGLCAACGPKPKGPEPDYAGAKARAGQAHKSLDRAGRASAAPAPSLGPAPEAAPVKAKVLDKDGRGCTWLESEGLVTVGENDSRHQARAAAVAEARKSAMQDFLGVEVRSRFMDFQQEGLRDQESLTESILQTTRLGRILDEKLEAEGPRDLPGCSGCRYHVRLKSCLTPVPPDGDKDFHAELDISDVRYREGDEAKLAVTASRDCYVYVYNVGMDWETALIVPNDMVQEVRLKAGEKWEYPGEELRRRGVRLVAQLPEGKKISAETIRLIVSKTPLPKKLEDPAFGGYLGVLRRLNASRLEWSDDAQAFTIYAR